VFVVQLIDAFSGKGFEDFLYHFTPGVKSGMIISLFLHRDPRGSYREWQPCLPSAQSFIGG
jgi:hypothetical protein